MTIIIDIDYKKRSNLMRVLIFAHFDHIGIIRADILSFLIKANTEYDVIYFVSTNLKKSELLKIPSAITTIVRENHGYDFYSYRAGLLKFLQTNLAGINKGFVTFMNSSIIILDREKLIKNLKKSFHNNSCVYGITTSYEIQHHIQSYLITIPFDLLRNEIFLHWWQNMEPLNDKREIIFRYELGLSVLLTELGYELKSTYKPSVFVRFTKIQNPCFSQPERLLEHVGCVKVQLLRDNPHNRNLSEILEYFKESEINQRILEHVCAN